MKINPVLLGHFFFFNLGAWLISTIFIDFFTVIAVFKNVSNIFEAGTVGMYVFSSFNKFELIFGISLLGISLINPLANVKVKRLMIFFSLTLLSIALYYNFFLSPKISTLTVQMNDIGLGNEGYRLLENSHETFHKRYISIDSIKLLLLLILLGLGIGKGRTFMDQQENVK
jgi:hypothetical protein